MPDTNDQWKLWICGLFKDYLTAGRGANDLPDADTLPFYTFADGAELPDVCLEIDAVTRKRSHEYLIPFTLHFTLHTIHTGTGADTELQAETWAQAIRRRLQDTTSLNTWLSALTLEQRTGWRIPWAPTMNEEADVEFVSDSGRRHHTEYLRCSVQISGE